PCSASSPGSRTVRGPGSPGSSCARAHTTTANVGSGSARAREVAPMPRTPSPRLSVALCTYHGASYVDAQVASLTRQTRLPDELIVCDDLSTDDTVSILERFARAAPFPVRIHVNEQTLRSTKNFEQAISLCSGDVIFLCDQDDVWEPEKLAR